MSVGEVVGMVVVMAMGAVLAGAGIFTVVVAFVWGIPGSRRREQWWTAFVGLVCVAIGVAVAVCAGLGIGV